MWLLQEKAYEALLVPIKPDDFNRNEDRVQSAWLKAIERRYDNLSNAAGGIIGPIAGGTNGIEDIHQQTVPPATSLSNTPASADNTVGRLDIGALILGAHTTMNLSAMSGQEKKLLANVVSRQSALGTSTPPLEHSSVLSGTVRVSFQSGVSGMFVAKIMKRDAIAKVVPTVSGVGDGSSTV